jgi:hypothetical protein
VDNIKMELGEIECGVLTGWFASRYGEGRGICEYSDEQQIRNTP